MPIIKYATCLYVNKMQKLKAHDYLKQLMAKLHPKKKSHEDPFDLSYLCNLYVAQDRKCLLTGIEMSLDEKHLNAMVIDKSNSDHDYNRRNIQLVCKWARDAKGTHSNSEFTEILRMTTNDSRFTSPPILPLIDGEDCTDAMFCDHANECPMFCTCNDKCYCRVHGQCRANR